MCADMPSKRFESTLEGTLIEEVAPATPLDDDAEADEAAVDGPKACCIISGVTTVAAALCSIVGLDEGKDDAALPSSSPSKPPL